MSRPKHQPSSARVLTQWVDAYAREHGLPPKRVRDWISYMILGGRLERSRTAEVPHFAIKGAVAIEMRLPQKARATRDIDLVVDLVDGDLTAALRHAVEGDYQGFEFRVKGEPHGMPNNSVRVEVALEYRGRGWGTIQVDLSPREGGRTEVERVVPLDLEPFGLESPGALPCLSLRYQIAQKIHAMTEPVAEEDAPGERFRDLVDLLLMKQLGGELVDLRESCTEVFAIRATHDWPPVVNPPESWAAPFAALAEEVGLPILRLEDATREVQAFVDVIERAK